MGDTSVFSSTCAKHTLPAWRGPLALAAYRQGGMASSAASSRGMLLVRSGSTEGSSSSSSKTSEKEANVVTQPSRSSSTSSSLSSSPPVGCKACGRTELESGCNGEGRIQGGIGALPGFDWWPIKAYRPCPAFIQSGGRYRRSGQSLNELAFGRKTSGDDLDVSERLKR